MKFGYARVSTRQQDLTVQVNDLKKAGAKKIFAEKYTGTSIKRPQFEKLLDTVQAGDTVIITKLDRLARNTRDALNITQALKEKKVKLHIISLGAVNQMFGDDSMSELLFTMISAFAQFERDLIVSRTAEGKEWAKQHDPNFIDGRPRKYDETRIAYAYRLKKEHNYSFTQLEKITGISRATLYRRLKEYELTHKEEKSDGSD